MGCLVLVLFRHSSCKASPSLSVALSPDQSLAINTPNPHTPRLRVQPVVEGGGLQGLENFRTLCTACHAGATKELMARRAKQRSAAAAAKAGGEGEGEGEEGDAGGDEDGDEEEDEEEGLGLMCTLL